MKPKSPVGVREVQRSLGLSRPRLASYHLERLEKAGLVKNVEGAYVADKVILKSFVRLQRQLIPRYFFYFVFFLCLTLGLFFIVRPAVLSADCIIGLSGVIIATYETISVWRRHGI